MAPFEDCDYLTPIDLTKQEYVSVRLATNGIKTLHVTTVFHNPSNIFNRFEITYVNPPERRLYTFESLEAAREKYNQL